ncbi:MAG: protein kinase [Candidatus Obscuribacterales bacterium]|nr:protein kinase [Candidatus Obscuribacterales bacterium]
MSSSPISFSHRDYVAIEELGRGGMGIVYRCKDLRLDRDVAVKVIGWSLSDSQVVRFHQEARALAKLQHPNILAIENFAHSDDGSLFLVMELLKGKRLSDIIESKEDIPFVQALEVFIQICNGLSHAHNRDILHRDIKPSNIFLDDTKYDTAHVTITDFGLAKLVTEDQRLTKTGISIGSPPYMSPEQANGSNVDERSDLYAVGCLMFEVLSGDKPFSGSSIPHILMKHAKEPPPRLSEQVPEKSFPSEIDTIISTCLAKSPADRFQSVSELGEALQKLLNRSSRRYADGTGFSGSYSQQTLMEKSNLSGQDQSQRHSKLGLHVVLSLLVLGILTIAGAGWLIFADRSNESDLPPEEPYLTDSTGDEDIPPPEETIKTETKKQTPLVVINRRDARKHLEELLARYREKDGAAFPSISLARSDVRDKDLELLEGLPIKKLNLFRTAITDSGLEHLSKLPQLEELDLGITKITDEGVKLLRQFPSLKTIRLTSTAITDAGVSELSR